MNIHRISIRREPHPYGYVWRMRWANGPNAGQAVSTAPAPGGQPILLQRACTHLRALEAFNLEYARMIREQTDAQHPRLNADGTINAAHVAEEQTRRERAGLRSYIAELDGPGRFRPDDQPGDYQQKENDRG